MDTKKTAKPKAKSKAKAVAKKKDNSMWIGGSKLLDKSQGIKNAEEKNTILVISNVLGVSPFGINVLGGNPYINKLGRKQKLAEYGKGKERVEYRWIHRAFDDTAKALVEAFIIDEKGERISAKVIGECSPATIKMGTLAGYQNHIALTRAHNRVIEEHYGHRIHQDMLENIAKLQQKGQDVPAIDTSVSAEEVAIQPETVKVAPKVETVDIVEYECHSCGNPLSKPESDFSSKVFKKPLCRSCQEEAKDNK